MRSIKLLVQPFGLSVKIVLDKIDLALKIRDLRKQIAAIIGCPQEVLTLINLTYRCKISNHTVFGSLQEVRHTSLKDSQTVLCLSPMHNLYIHSLKSHKRKIELGNGEEMIPPVKRQCADSMLQVKLRCIHLINGEQSIYDSNIHHIYAVQSNLKQHLIIHFFDFRDAKYRSPSKLRNRETLMLKVHKDATVETLKKYINTSYDLDIYRERWVAVGTAAVIVKPGNPEDTNFSRRNFLAKGDIKLSDAECLAAHRTLLVFITSQMPYKIKWD